MGRLPKKKSGGVKKKKKQVQDQSDAGQGDVVALERESAQGAKTGSREEKKRPARPARKPAAHGKPASGKTEKNILEKSIQFLREVKVELKKVTWPSKKQTVGSTVVVLILVIIVSFFLGIVDVGLSSLVRVVLQ